MKQLEDKGKTEIEKQGERGGKKLSVLLICIFTRRINFCPMVKFPFFPISCFIKLYVEMKIKLLTVFNLAWRQQKVKTGIWVDATKSY